MTPWKDQGFVQDSEDEGSLGSVTPPSKRGGRQVRHQSPQVRIYQSQNSRRSNDLSAPTQVLQETPHEQALLSVSARKISFSASPAASQGSDLQRDAAVTHSPAKSAILGQLVADRNTLVENAALAVESAKSTPIESSGAPRPIERAPSIILDDETIYPDHPIRSFRQRKPIQLHPYRLEIEKYKHAFKARGLRPVQVINESQDMNRRFHGDSQEQDESWQSSQISVGEDIGQDVDMFGSSPPVVAQVADQTSSRSSQESDLTLKGPGNFGQRPDEGFTTTKRLKGGKRRKVLDYSGQHRRSMHAATGAIVSEDDHGRSKLSIFDIPPSPPDTSPSMLLQKDTPHGHLKRLGRRVTPLKLITPATSSETRHDLQDLQSAPLSKDSPSLQPVDEATVIESDASTDLSSSDGEEEMQTITRRIRGVLPASWLKLDQKVPVAKPPIDGRTSRSDARKANGFKGVAQRRIARTDPSREMATMFPFEEDSSDSGNVQPIVARQTFDEQLHQPKISSFIRPEEEILQRIFADEDPGSDMEDDQFDYMASSTVGRSRNKKSGVRKVSKLHQSRLDGPASGSLLRVPKARSLHPNTGTSRSKKGGIARNKPYARSRSTAPQLSIVDHIASSPKKRAVLPPFLRLAARAASTRPDLGRHSPTRKHMRLATHEDTLDATKSLQGWRDGRIKPKHTPRTRHPLVERSTNSLAGPSGKESGPHSLGFRAPRDRLLQPQYRTVRHEDALHTQNPLARPHVGQAEGRRLSRRALDHIRDQQFDVQLEDIMGTEGTTNLSAFAAPPRQQIKHTLPARAEQAGAERLECPRDHGSKTMRPHPADNLGQLLPREPANSRRKPRAARKLEPKRLDVSAMEYRQVESITEPEPSPAMHSDLTEIPAGSSLQGLYAFGHRYPIAFDVQRLPKNVRFVRDCFLGSGQFQQCLRMNHRNLDDDIGSHVEQINTLDISWGRWNQTMANHVHLLFERLAIELSMVDFSLALGETRETFLKDASVLLRSIIHMNSTWLSFSDPVDRQALISMFLKGLEASFRVLAGLLDTGQSGEDELFIRKRLRQVLTMELALASQLWAIDQQLPEQKRASRQLSALLHNLSEVLLRSLLGQGTYWLRTHYEVIKQHADRQNEHQLDDSDLESLVILHHVSSSTRNLDSGFWQVFNALQQISKGQIYQAHDLESHWMTNMTLLPILQFDLSGKIADSDIISATQDNWHSIKSLISPVLGTYTTTARMQGSSVNDYVRALLARCIILIQDWGWHKCEIIIGLFFDFFAKTQFAGLHRETVHGSPAFLNDLSNDSALVPVHGENAFHAFLKLTGSGLRAMRSIHPARKIQSIAWRCIPNHGRSYPKDQPLLETDLQALRNHHDLLCTLYWACPAGFRPPIRLIKLLVDHNTSHRQACRLSVRSWSCLASYAMISKTEDADLEPFATWFSEILSQSIAQFKQARIEAESYLDEARRRGEEITLATSFNVVIERNQSQILATLSDAVQGMKQAIQKSQSKGSAEYLMRASDFDSILGLFDPRNARVSQLLIDVLGAFEALDTSPREIGLLQDRSTESEDSQEYGDWPDIEEDVVDNSGTDTLPSSYALVTVFRMLSNVFGAESEADDALCSKVIATWVPIAAREVREKRKDWSAFISALSPFAWSQLRETTQHRKFTCYFLAAVIRTDGKAYDACKDAILSAWLVSLVERESLLKHQHDLINAILSLDKGEGLLANLPFICTAQSINISLQQLRDRRLSLISTLLSNMQREFRAALDGNNVIAIRHRYTTYLKQTTIAMKNNFLELGHQDGYRGAYVSFVQRIVEFLQQYTSDICIVDKFFTDSAAFPLPSGDPTYVVGKLKGYIGRLRDGQAIKQLAIFVQAVSERAASDGEHTYLIGQLVEAMSNEFEHGDETNPTLRSVLLGMIFPAYFKLAFSTATGWILAAPILAACREIFTGLHGNFSVLQETSRKATEGTLLGLLEVIYESCRLVVDHAGLLEQPFILRTLREVLGMVHALIPCLDYVARYSSNPTTLQEYVGWTLDFSALIEAYLLDPGTAVEPNDLSQAWELEPRCGALRAFCEKELSEGLAQRWSVTEGRYYVKRGHRRNEIVVHLATLDEEKQALKCTIFELRENSTGQPGRQYEFYDIDLLI